MIIMKPGIFYYAESDAPAECSPECDAPTLCSTELQDTCVMSFCCKDGTFGAMQFNSIEPMLKLPQKFSELRFKHHELDSLVLYYTQSSANMHAVIAPYLEFVFARHQELKIQKKSILVGSNEMIVTDKDRVKKELNNPSQMIFSHTTTTTTINPLATRLPTDVPHPKRMKPAPKN